MQTNMADRKNVTNVSIEIWVLFERKKKTLNYLQRRVSPGKTTKNQCDNVNECMCEIEKFTYNREFCLKANYVIITPCLAMA